MKKILSMLMASLLTLGLTTGCSRWGNDEPKIGLIVSTLNNPFLLI